MPTLQTTKQKIIKRLPGTRHEVKREKKMTQQDGIKDLKIIKKHWLD